MLMLLDMPIQLVTLVSEIGSTGVILYSQAPSLTRAMCLILISKFGLQWLLKRATRALHSWVSKGQLHGGQQVWKLLEKEGLWSLRCFGKEFYEYNEYSRNLEVEEHRDSVLEAHRSE